MRRTEQHKLAGASSSGQTSEPGTCAIVPTTWGWLRIRATSRGCLRVEWPLSQRPVVAAQERPAAPEALGWAWLAAGQIAEYLDGWRTQLTVPVDWGGTSEFARGVLEACHSIPFGQTRTYAELASAAGSPRAARAVGQVMAHNRRPLIVPCHRVVASNGSLGGFGGGLAMKRWLLELEGVIIPAGPN